MAIVYKFKKLYFLYFKRVRKTRARNISPHPVRRRESRNQESIKVRMKKKFPPEEMYLIDRV
jgi:hypothetical protein